MGETAAQTVSEIDEVRDRLDDKVRLLEERLPSGVVIARWGKRVIGLGGLATVGLFAYRKLRSDDEEPEAQTVIRFDVPDGNWKPVVAAVGALWLIARWRDNRETKKLRQAILASR